MKIFPFGHCLTCKFFISREDSRGNLSSKGKCYLNPPQRFQDTFLYPDVHITDGCSKRIRISIKKMEERVKELKKDIQREKIEPFVIEEIKESGNR